MTGRVDSERMSRRRVDAAAKARFVAALRTGISRDVAAAEAGFTAEAFYYARRRDGMFRLAWIWAMELSAADQREAHRAAAIARAANGGEIAPNNQRVLQRRRMRGTQFTEARKQLFLDHLAGTADVLGGADAAGVHLSTVYKHRRIDARFAIGWDAALRTAYALLEAGAVRQRIEAQRRAAFDPDPAGEPAREFERVMKLLARLDRQSGSGVREMRHGRLKRLSFDESIEALDSALLALGVKHKAMPPVPDAES